MKFFNSNQISKRKFLIFCVRQKYGNACYISLLSTLYATSVLQSPVIFSYIISHIPNSQICDEKTLKILHEDTENSIMHKSMRYTQVAYG